MVSPVVFSIPVFASLIAFEAWWASRHDPTVYADRRDTWGNIFLGSMSVVWGALFGLATGYVFVFCYEAAPFKFAADNRWTWLVLFFVDDLAYYIFHRASHRCRLFWNFHVVHHSSTNYNLSVAVRQSWFSGVLHWIFYAPIMLLGFAPWMFALMHGFNLIYQFWIHTKFVRRLGWAEYVLNTPSHHRVHHGVNDAYLDKNYGGVLIIWDSLLGTFVRENDEPRYGITKQISGYDPLWINTHAWFEMAAAIRASSGIASKMRCVFGSPDMTENSRYLHR